MLVDPGDHGGVFARNLGAWLEQKARSPGSFAHRAVVISHGHTITSPPGKDRSRNNLSDGLVHTWNKLGPAFIQGPNLKDLHALKRLNPGWFKSAITPARLVQLEPGLTPLRWEDGSNSERIFLLTYRIAPPEERSFPQMETVVVISSPPGYLVISVCSHMARDGHPPSPFHALELVQKMIDRGKLKAGPVHTVVTGICGVMRAFRSSRGGDDTPFDDQAFKGHLSGIQTRLGVKRIYLNHCALFVDPQRSYPLFKAVFKAAVKVALPGSCLPISSPP